MGCCDSTPAYRKAVSGFFDTLASPLVNTPDSIEVVVAEAAGDVMKTGGRPAAATVTTTTRATSDAPASATSATRIDDFMLAFPHDANDAIRGEVTTHTHVVKRQWRIADLLSGARLLLIPAIWFAALVGDGRLVGFGLLVAGATDFFDGYVARRLGQESAAGARLDSLADNVLLISAMAWIELLHPEILRNNTMLIVATFGLYVASLSTGLVRFHQLGNLHLYSSRVAGGALYSFAVMTLIAGAYEPLLLWMAAVAFMVSSAETLVGQLLLSAIDENMGSIFLAAKRRAEIRTIQPIGSARKPRSQEPHSAKVVGSRTRPTSSMATSAAPNPNETGP